MAGPRLSIGLPVRNGSQHLRQGIDSLLGQTFTDFELVISDNASTDDTEHICREYAAKDERVRYLRQPRNVGISANHRIVVEESRGALFKWVGHDDLYAHDLIERCVRVLDENPDVVLATVWTAMTDESGRVTSVVTDCPLYSDSASAPQRYRGLLYAETGDDDYGVIRRDVLLRTSYSGTYYHADRSFVAELALHGRFVRIPEPLYFRLDRTDRAGREHSVRDWCVNHDPRRASRLRHPTARLLAEYLWSFVAAIQRSPLTAEEKRRCYAELIGYLSLRAVRGTVTLDREPPPVVDPSTVDVAAAVSGGRESGP